MFTISGTAGVTIGKVNNLSATFGASGSPGLVINNGSLSSLDMTINSNFEVGGVTIDANDLNFNYASTNGGTFSMSGTAGVTVGRVDGLTATFGASGTPGLVLAGDNLSSLDMTINSNFEVAGVTFQRHQPQLRLRGGNDNSFSMAGTVGATVGGVDNLSVTFGSGGTKGLVITGGSLSSLDMTINGTFDVDAVAFSATEPELRLRRDGRRHLLDGRNRRGQSRRDRQPLRDIRRKRYAWARHLRRQPGQPRHDGQRHLRRGRRRVQRHRP